MVCESSNINIFIGNFRTVKENFTISTNREPTWKLLSLLTVTADYQNPFSLQGTGKIQNPTWKLLSLLTVTADYQNPLLYLYT